MTGGDHAGLVIERVSADVAQVRLDRPDRLNALTPDLVVAVGDAFTDLGQDSSCRVIVLTGTGRGFCAGLDLASHRDREEDRFRYPGERLDSQERFARMVRAIRAIRQPVIAAVNGPCAGAGFGLTLAADVRIAAASASFHVAAVKIGLSAGECGISYHLPRAIGSTRAFEVMLTGRPIDATEAERIGLVSRAVPDAELAGAAMDVAEAIRGNSPFAVRMTKQVMWANLDAQSLDHGLELENRTQILATMTRDSPEAMRAFLEKRSPNFSGE